MGEFAYYAGQRIKIGTCEEMLYLRADQVSKLDDASRSVMPHVRSLLFRFPWPGEDSVTPGHFSDTGIPRGVYDLDVPAEGVSHGQVQFADTYRRGLLVLLPCPHSPEGRASGIKYQYNGYSGHVRIAYQRVWEDRLVTVATCGGCGAAYRYPDLESVEPLVVALRAYADRDTRAVYPPDPSRGKWWHDVADRVLDGYRAGAAERIIGLPIPPA
jgi:hypothetical protein